MTRTSLNLSLVLVGVSRARPFAFISTLDSTAKTSHTHSEVRGIPTQQTRGRGGVAIPTSVRGRRRQNKNDLSRVAARPRPPRRNVTLSTKGAN